MRTGLPPALAALGAALLLSSIEAEGKMLLLPPPSVTMQRSRKEKKKKKDLATIACSVFPVLRVFSGCFSPRRETPPSEVCPWSGSQVQLFRILLNPSRAVLCGLLALVPAVCCPHCHLPFCLPRGPAVREGATAAPSSAHGTPASWCCYPGAPERGRARSRGCPHHLARGCDLGDSMK